jgi:hypothetical protein
VRIKLLQPYAGHQPGDTIDRDDTEARWLIGIGRATSDKHPATHQRAVAPGEHGADPLAGGDPTRLYGLVTNKAPLSHNAALPIPGAPIQYNKGVAPEGEPTRPGEVSGRPEAKREAQTNRERPAGSPRLETADPAPAPGKTSESKPSTSKGKSSKS